MRGLQKYLHKFLGSRSFFIVVLSTICHLHSPADFNGECLTFIYGSYAGINYLKHKLYKTEKSY
jgi:hypothetical protein